MNAISNASFLNASSAYGKSNNIEPLINESDINNNFGSALKQAVVNTNNFIPGFAGNNISTISAIGSNNPGLMKLATEAFNKARDKIKQSEYISNKALMKEASLTDVVTAISEAEIALQALIAIRDKALAAYQEVIKMQI
jgi:flagellar hook-basal body complex protein FliE